MLSKPIENKTCWERGLGQPLGMATGSAINLSGAVASLVMSAQSQAINPLPFICTGMLTSALYLGSNGYRAYQICTDKERAPEKTWGDKVRDEKITITIER